jgi:LacI family transcriptional regulator
MHDVARHAGVSLKTVSRVVNDEGGVSPAFIKRVETAVAALGYRPDEHARRLRRAASHSGTIGFVLVDVANPFFSSILRGIEDVARGCDYLVLAGSTDGSPARERQLVERFIDRRVDGLIVVPSGPGDDLLRAEIERGSAVVLLDLEIDVGHPVDLVRSDHYQGAKTATTHLLDAGHRNIAYMGDDPSIMSAGHRLTGFRDAMAAAGVEVDEERVIAAEHTVDEWHDVAMEFFRSNQGTTAIFTAQNFVTMGVVSALHDLDVHHSVALVGFDDIEFAEVLEPGITVIPQMPRELGRRAAELLFTQIDGGGRQRSQIIIDHPLIKRGSGEIPPPPEAN